MIIKAAVNGVSFAISALVAIILLFGIGKRYEAKVFPIVVDFQIVAERIGPDGATFGRFTFERRRGHCEYQNGSLAIYAINADGRASRVNYEAIGPTPPGGASVGEGFQISRLWRFDFLHQFELVDWYAKIDYDCHPLWTTNVVTELRPIPK